MSDEEYVRGKWERVVSRPSYRSDRRAWIFNLGGPWFDTEFPTEADAFQVAAEYTRERERQIAEKQLQILWLKHAEISPFSSLEYGGNRSKMSILAVLKAQLTELQRGMK